MSDCRISLGENCIGEILSKPESMGREMIKENFGRIHVMITYSRYLLFVECSLQDLEVFDEVLKPSVSVLCTFQTH